MIETIENVLITVATGMIKTGNTTNVIENVLITVATGMIKTGNTTNVIETRENVLITVVTGMIKDATIPTAPVALKSIIITTSIVDTVIVLTEKNVITNITTIKAIGMITKAIGNLGSTGTGTQKTIRTFTGTDITTAKTTI